MGKKEKLSSQKKETLYEVIINLVRENPMLYNKTHPDYKDKDKKNKKWNEFKEILNTSLQFGLKKGKFHSNTCDMYFDLSLKRHNFIVIFYKSGSTVKCLWKELRTKFMGIRLQAQKVPPSGAGAKNVPEIEWAFYDSMRFLENFLTPRHIISSNKMKAAIAEKRPDCEQFAKKSKL